MVAIRQSETPGACPVRPARSCRVQRLQSCASHCTALHPISPLRARSKGGFSASGHGGGPPWPRSTKLRAPPSHSAVVPAAQPKGPRFALRGCAPGTTACAQYDLRGFHPVAKAARRHCQATQGCRVSMPSSAAMPGRQSLRLVAARHHRWCPVRRPGVPVSGQGGKPPCPCTRSVDKRRRRAASHGVASPLRPPAALLHKAPFHKVRCSRCAIESAPLNLK